MNSSISLYSKKISFHLSLMASEKKCWIWKDNSVTMCTNAVCHGNGFFFSWFCNSDLLDETLKHYFHVNLFLTHCQPIVSILHQHLQDMPPLTHSVIQLEIHVFNWNRPVIECVDKPIWGPSKIKMGTIFQPILDPHVPNIQMLAGWSGQKAPQSQGARGGWNLHRDCGAVLTDRPSQCHMDIDTVDGGSGFHF